jgi:hypothetical protein
MMYRVAMAERPQGLTMRRPFVLPVCGATPATFGWMFASRIGTRISIQRRGDGGVRTRPERRCKGG